MRGYIHVRYAEKRVRKSFWILDIKSKNKLTVKQKLEYFPERRSFIIHLKPTSVIKLKVGKWHWQAKI